MSLTKHMSKLQCKELLCQLAQGQYGEEHRLVNAHCMSGSSGDVTLWQASLGPVHNSLFYLFSNRVSLCSPGLPGTSLPLPSDGMRGVHHYPCPAHDSFKADQTDNSEKTLST